jgi:hypothetical protein
MYTSKQDLELGSNTTWLDSVDKSTDHMYGMIKTLYDFFSVHHELLENIKSLYPHGCVTDSIWDIVVSDATLVQNHHIQSVKQTLKSVRFTYDDLVKLGNANNYEEHMNAFKLNMNHVIISSFFTINDVRRMSLQSGLRDLHLCGTVTLIDDVVYLENKKQWVRQNSYQLPINDGRSMYWSMRPYDSDPTVPLASDLAFDTHKIHVVMHPPKLDWIQAMVYYKEKGCDSVELDEAFQVYQHAVMEFANSSGGQLYWDKWDDHHETLSELGLHIWMVDYKRLPKLLLELSAENGL